MWKLLLDGGINTWGLIVGVLGLGVTIAGLRYAIKAATEATQAKAKAGAAERAAQDATKAASRRAAQDELVLLNRAGGDLLHSLQAEEWSLACYCAQQIRQLVAEFEGQHRGSDFVDEGELAKAADHVGFIYDECAKMAQDESKATDRKRHDVTKAAGETVHRLGKLLGSTRKSREAQGG